jgi:CBS domain-containing protein
MLTVRDFMTSPVLTVRTTTPLKEVARLLAERHISGLPVVDEQGTVLGVVSEADFLAKERGAEDIHHRRLSRIRGESTETRAQIAKVRALCAGEAMTAPAITIGSGRPLSEAARLMADRRVARLPVVDRGALVGIVTRADVVRAFTRTDDELTATIRDDILLHTLWLDPNAFHVDVRDGQVRISGHVERRSSADAVQHSIAMVPGVVAVRADVTWSMDDSEFKPASADAVFPFGVR